MWALDTPRIPVDRLTAAKNLRNTFRRIAATVSALVVLLTASTAAGQQAPARPVSSHRSSAPSSTIGDTLGSRLQQFRSAGMRKSDAVPPQSGLSEGTQSSLNGPEKPQSADTSDSSDPPEIEVTQAVPELFLDLTQETPASPAANSTESPHRSLEVTAGSSPTQVLMRAVAWIVIALCIFSLTILGLRRWQRQRGLLPTTNTRSRVLETLSLGPGRTFSLIELAGFRALVASDAGGIRSLVLAPVSFHDELIDAGQPADLQIPGATQPS